MSWDKPISHKALTYRRLKEFLIEKGKEGVSEIIAQKVPNESECLTKDFFTGANFKYVHTEGDTPGIFIHLYSVGSSIDVATKYVNKQVVIEPDIAYYMPLAPQPTELCNIHILTLGGTTYNETNYSDELIITVTKGISEWTSGTFAPPSGKQGTFTVTVNGNNYQLPPDKKVTLLNIVDDLYLVSSFTEEEPSITYYLVIVLTDEHSYYNNKTKETIATVPEGEPWSMPIATITNNLSFLTGYELKEITVSDGMTKDDTSCSVLSATKNYIILVTSKEKQVVPSDDVVISINLPSTCLDPNAKVLINDNGDGSIIVIKENNQLISSETFKEVSSLDKILNDGDYYLLFDSGALDEETGAYNNAKYTILYVKLNGKTYTKEIALCVLPYFGYSGTNVNIDWGNTKYLALEGSATCTITSSSSISDIIENLKLSSGYKNKLSINPIKFIYENLEKEIKGTLPDGSTEYKLVINSPYKCSLTFTKILSFLNIEATLTDLHSSNWWEGGDLHCLKITNLTRTLILDKPCSLEDEIVLLLSFDESNNGLKIADLNVGYFGSTWESNYETFLGKFKTEEQNKQTLRAWLPESIDYDDGNTYSRGTVSISKCSAEADETGQVIWWKPCSECTFDISYVKEYKEISYGEAEVMGANINDPEDYENLVCRDIFFLGDECIDREITGEDLYNLECQCFTGEEQGLTTVKSVKLGKAPKNGVPDPDATEIGRDWISHGSEIRENYPFPELPTFYITYKCSGGGGDDHFNATCAYTDDFSVTYNSTANTPSLGTDIIINGNIKFLDDKGEESTPKEISKLNPTVIVAPYGPLGTLKYKITISIPTESTGGLQLKLDNCEGNPFEYEKVIDFSTDPPTEVISQ